MQLPGAILPAEESPCSLRANQVSPKLILGFTSCAALAPMASAPTAYEPAPEEWEVTC